MAALTKGPWSPNQPEAMASAGSLASLSSVGSVKTPAQLINPAKTPERHQSRPDTAGSTASVNQALPAISAPPQGPLSPTSSIRRNHSKRLTPSSIPFFRRSSSQSMQVPVFNGALPSTSPTYLSTWSSKKWLHVAKTPARWPLRRCKPVPSDWCAVKRSAHIPSRLWTGSQR